VADLGFGADSGRAAPPVVGATLEREPEEEVRSRSMRERKHALRSFVRVAAILCVVAGIACAPFNVKVNSDPDVDFEALRSYAWLARPELSDPNPFADNPLLRKRVREAVEGSLSSLGFVAASPGEADFQMTFHVTLEDRTVGQGWPGGGYGYSRYRYGTSGGSFFTRSFQQGTLILDAVSRDGSQLLWRGWVSGAVPTSDSDRDRVPLAVREILARFPAGGRTAE
jgi:hypothetical protein